MATPNCAVCTVETSHRIESGALVCGACKRFFRRMRYTRGNKMYCFTGLNKCAEKFGNFITTSEANGKTWRNLCSLCRYNKCLKVWFGEDDQNLKQLSRGHVNQPLLLSPINLDLNIAESLVRTIVEAARQYKLDMDMSPIRNINVTRSVTTYIEAYAVQEEHFGYNLIQLKKFVSSMPGFNATSVGDRCRLFSNSYYAILSAEASNRLEPLYAGMSSEYYNAYVRFFPVLAVNIPNDARRLWSMFREWQPTTVEFSFLLAFCYFISSGEDARMENSKGLLAILEQLRGILHAYVAKQFKGEPAVIAQRLDLMRRIIALLYEITLRRYEHILIEFKRYPQLLQNNSSKLYVSLLDNVKTHAKVLPLRKRQNFIDEEDVKNLERIRLQ